MFGDLSERLSLIIDAKTGGAVTGIRNIETQTHAAAERVEVLKAKIADLDARQAKNATATRANQIAKLRKEYDGLNASLANVPRNAGKADALLQRIGLGGVISGRALVGGLAIGAGALAGGGLVKFLRSGVQDYLNLADQIRSFQFVTSTTATQASELVEMTTKLGASADVASAGFFRLGKNVAMTPEKFRELGIEIAKTKDGNTDLVGTLLNVSDAWRSTEDGAKRNQIVFQAFGRSGASMIPVLAAGRQQLEAFAKTAKDQGRVLSQSDLDTARQYEIQMRELKDSFEGLKIEASKGLVPALAEVTQTLTDGLTLLTKHNIPKYVEMTTVFGLVSHFLNPSGKAKAKAEQKLAAEQKQAQLDAIDKAAFGTLAGPFDVLQGPVNIAKAKADLADARDALAKAKQDREQAQRDLSSLGSGGASPAEIQAATLRLQAAQEHLASVRASGKGSLAAAQASVLSAQQRINELNSKGAVTTDQLTTAQYRLRDANKAVADAQQKVKDAQAAQNTATGLSAENVLNRLISQSRNQRALATAQGKLIGGGLAPEVVKYLDDLEKQVPGTLAKIAASAGPAMIDRLNSQFGLLQGAQSAFANALHPDDAMKLQVQADGKAWADAIAKGYNDRMDELSLAGRLHPPVPKYGPFALPQTTLPTTRQGLAPGLLGPQINLNGPITVVAPDPKKLADGIERQSRLHALAGNGGAGGHLLGG